MTDIATEQTELLELLRAKTVIYGKRKLASGKMSHYYIDGKQVTLDARGAYLIGRCLLSRMQGRTIVAVGGPTLGADPIVGAILAEAGRQSQKLTGFIVRKETKDHGTSKLLEGPALAKGMKVALVEDVITTGGSVLKAVEAVQVTGAEVVQILCLVDREQGALETLKPYAYTPLFSKTDLRIKPESEL